MAKTSSIQRNLKRIRLSKKFLKKRELLKKIIDRDIQLALSHASVKQNRYELQQIKNKPDIKPFIKINFFLIAKKFKIKNNNSPSSSAS